MRIIITLLFVVLCVLIPPQIIMAQEASFLVCNDESCEPNKISPFFNNSVLWQPGTIYTSFITIKNTSEFDRHIGHQGIRKIFVNERDVDIAQVMDLKVTRMSVNKIVYHNRLSNFYNSSGGSLGILGVGKTDSFAYQITMLDAGNEYQGKKTQFDLVFGFFFPTQIPTLTPTPTLTINPSSTPTIAPKATNTLTPTVIFNPVIDNTPAPADILESFFSNSIQALNDPIRQDSEGQVEAKTSSGGSIGYIMVPQEDPHVTPYFLNPDINSSSLQEDVSGNSAPQQSGFNINAWFFDSTLVESVQSTVINFFEIIILFVASMLQ